ncbi:CLAVATA3/ESR (CLE)-related protein TDIF-like [Gastrolobium bilobum]|uniref:CLAVATA3/ESR (CLE)-related protein TDIF-like n=1 Tax=Gastrolobium bilobum TaxID=150636 RepID=UPI002AB2A55E|nr:CLAVATA3/ESR (CLE)-related protein TDIF-like [Gastrolobium bilobum]
MAGDTASSFSTCMAIFFSLLLVSHFTMAMLESPLTSTKEGAKKRNTMVTASAREGGSTQNSKDMALRDANKGIHAHDQQQGPKRGHSRSPRPPFQWQNKIFNASAHEVPSGPNPISNR